MKIKTTIQRTTQKHVTRKLNKKKTMLKVITMKTRITITLNRNRHRKIKRHISNRTRERQRASEGQRERYRETYFPFSILTSPPIFGVYTSSFNNCWKGLIKDSAFAESLFDGVCNFMPGGFVRSFI